MECVEGGSYQVVLTSKGLNTRSGVMVIKRALSVLKRPVCADTILLICPDDYPVHERIINACKEIGFVDENIVLSCDELQDGFVPSVCYVTEGNTFEVLDYMRKRGFFERVRACVNRGGIYIGSSAGAMIASKDVSLAKDFDSNFVGLVDFQALGILGDIEVVPHYSFEQLQKYLTLFGYDAEERNIINVADDEALMVEVEVTKAGLRVIKKKRVRESMV